MDEWVFKGAHDERKLTGERDGPSSRTTRLEQVEIHGSNGKLSQSCSVSQRNVREVARSRRENHKEKVKVVYDSIIVLDRRLCTPLPHIF